MEHLKFEWDEHKNTSNKIKHGISFEESTTVFYDEMALIIDDPDHSEQENRFIILVRASMQNYWLFATVIENLIRRFALSQQEKQQKPKANNIINSKGC